MGPNGRMEPRYLSQARWACVNNQFFINLVRPSTDMSDVRIYGSTIQKSGDSEKTGVTGSLSFPVGLLEPGETKSYDFEIYSGQKIIWD